MPLSEELLKRISDHTGSAATISGNIDPHIILTTEEKFELELYKYTTTLTGEKEWWTPFGIAFSLFYSLLTTVTYTDFFLSSDGWKAFTFFSLLAFGYQAINKKNRAKKTISQEQLIKNIKEKT